MSPVETARALGVSRNHLYRYLRSGQLKSFRLGNRRLINREALDDFRTMLEQKHSDQASGQMTKGGSGKWH